ncbi:hypothetical protein HK102_004449 [Quaeritorhiza haematococci]|nr:hypothetical protein HK102_004449 [Quaeritorhiza haematococci]
MFLNTPFDFSLFKFQDAEGARSFLVLLFTEVVKTYPKLQDMHVRSSTRGDTRLYNVTQVTDPGSRVPLQFWANYFACLCFSNVSLWFMPAREEHAMSTYSRQATAFIIETLKRTKLQTADRRRLYTINIYPLAELELFGRHSSLLARIQTKDLPGVCIFCGRDPCLFVQRLPPPQSIPQEDFRHWTLAGNVFFGETLAFGNLRRYVLTVDYHYVTAATSTDEHPIDFFSPKGQSCFIDRHRFSRGIFLVDTILLTSLVFVASPVQSLASLALLDDDESATESTVNIIHRPDLGDVSEQPNTWTIVPDVMAMIKNVTVNHPGKHITAVISPSDTVTHHTKLNALLLEKKVKTLMTLCSSDVVDEILASYAEKDEGLKKFTFVFVSLGHGRACMHVPKSRIKNCGLRLWRKLKKDDNVDMDVVEVGGTTVFRFYGSWFGPEDLIRFAKRLLIWHRDRLFLGVVTNIPFRASRQSTDITFNAMYMEDQGSFENNLRMIKQMNHHTEPDHTDPDRDPTPNHTNRVFLTQEACDQLERAARTNRTMLNTLQVSPLYPAVLCPPISI